MTLMGLVHTYQGLVIARVFLGVAECGFFPAAVYLLTIWYKRYEVMQRMAIFYAATSLSGAFSGLLAYSIQFMEGIAGRHGWQWIFILEGLIPVSLSAILYFILPDSPRTATFLSKHEKEFLVNRIALETGSGFGCVTNEDRPSFQQVKAAFKEWKIWAAVVCFWASSIGIYGFTATVPSIVQDLGYTSANAQLMTIPIYLFAVVCILVVAYLSERYRQRTPFIILGFSIASVGLIGMLVTRRYARIAGASYFFLFLVAAGFYSPFICIVCLIANNLAPSSKRAVGIALLISVGNGGGICGSNIFIATQAPTYTTGFGTCLGTCVCAIIMAYILRVAFKGENKKRDIFMEGKTITEVKAMFAEQELLDLGDKSPFFRYTL
ncbi:hypothetical protein LTR84_003606 [Exophiala bonariae]|uniref:Major facilitator superfamily (MFS) profile domain-containing protein n=1 Tax=Exophiala bonariae TaxID=1690606 RepID=A0AAV9NB57_9EURO|nr:hypothetical protein LTR84_003606 [Exophiala bonariae]